MTFWQALKGWWRRIDLFDPEADEFVGQLRDERVAAERSARASVRRRLDVGDVLVQSPPPWIERQEQRGWPKR